MAEKALEVVKEQVKLVVEARLSGRGHRPGGAPGLGAAPAIESQYVEVLCNHNLAVLTFETAKVAPLSGLSGGTTASATSAASDR